MLEEESEAGEEEEEAVAEDEQEKMEAEDTAAAAGADGAGQVLKLTSNRFKFNLLFYSTRLYGTPSTSKQHSTYRYSNSQ